MDPTNARATAGPSHLATRPAPTQQGGPRATLTSPGLSAGPVSNLGSLYPSRPLPPPPAILQPPIWPTAPLSSALSQPTSSSGGLVGASAPTQSSPSLSAGVQPSPASQTSTTNEGNAGLSLAEAAEAHSSAFTPSKPVEPPQRPQKQPRLPDPVDLWILSEAEAQNLIAFWHERLNPYVILLDRYLHTYDYGEHHRLPCSGASR